MLFVKKITSVLFVQKQRKGSKLRWNVFEHAQGPKTPRPIRDQDYHHVIG